MQINDKVYILINNKIINFNEGVILEERLSLSGKKYKIKYLSKTGFPIITTVDGDQLIPAEEVLITSMEEIKNNFNTKYLIITNYENNN